EPDAFSWKLLDGGRRVRDALCAQCRNLSRDRSARTCLQCGKMKPFYDYAKLPEKSGLRDKICRTCRNPGSKRTPRLGKYDPQERVLERILRNKFGITVYEYNRMLEEQNYSCAICEVSIFDLKVRLSVDHCHALGHVRGLLCNSCNTILGHSKDNVKTLQR